MDFTEATKQEARRRSHYTCVWCRGRQAFLQVHHIIPQAQGGANDLQNAVALCPNCHTLIGNNSDIRKQLREKRTWYWDYCAKQEESVPEQLARGLDVMRVQMSELEVQRAKDAQARKEFENRFEVFRNEVGGFVQQYITASPLGGLSSATTVSEVVQATSHVVGPRVVYSDSPLDFPSTPQPVRRSPIPPGTSSTTLPSEG